MSLRHIWAVTLKELRYIQRDRATLSLVVLTPTLLLFMMVYAVTADVQHVPVGALDLDRSQTSRAFLQQITLGDDLDLRSQVGSMEALEELLLKEEIHIAIVIPPGFERELLGLNGLPLQVIVDGTEPQTGGYAVDQILRRAEMFITDLLSSQLAVMGVDPADLEPIDMSIRTWYNPNRKAKVDVVPGLISMVLGLP